VSYVLVHNQQEQVRASLRLIIFSITLGTEDSDFFIQAEWDAAVKTGIIPTSMKDLKKQVITS
jgi:hypothetical protein